MQRRKPEPTSLSVALCTCDGVERYLEQQLASIAAQERPPDELVVCDDASVDATCALVRRFEATVAFPVRLHRNPVRVGASRNFAGAIERCAGDVIVLADQDDVWTPAKLRRLESAFAEGAPGLVYSDADIVDEALRPLGATLYEFQRMDRRFRSRLTGHALPHLVDLARGPLGLTQAFRASLLSLILPLPNYRATVMAHDVWIDLVAASVAPMVGLDDRLLAYRQHDAQLSGVRGGSPTTWARSRARWRPDREVQRAIATELLARLDGWAPSPGPASRGWDDRTRRSRRYLADRLRHLDARDTLPPALPARAAVVARELVSGRYGRHSRGAASAAKDLVRGRNPA